MRSVLAFVVLNLAAHTLSAQEHWVSTWAASPQPPRVLPQTPPANAQAPRPITDFNNQTVRMIVRASVGGRRARVTLSNAHGSAMLALGAAHIAVRAQDSAIVPGSDRVLTFSGKRSFTIPPGASAVSDPVDLEVPQLGDLAVSVYIPGDSGPLTMHATGLHTTYISQPGDATGQTELTNAAATSQSWYWLSGIDVLAPAQTGLIVAYGDSITDGATSSRDADASWPSLLARRLQSSPTNFAVVNQGISGNRVLRDGTGANALARFDRDVLSQPGVKWVMLLEGINDIGQATRAGASPNDAVTAGDLIAAYRQIVERAHLRGIKAIGCTLTPYEGAAYYSEAGEAIRESVNSWIRSGGAFDAVVDFDAATRDPERPRQFRAGFNNGDHLHPNDAGYRAMAEAVDLSIFAAQTANPLSAELKVSYVFVRNNLLKMSEKMPERDYGFKPSAEVQTFAMRVAHITDANMSVCAGLRGETKSVGARAKTSKADLVAAMKQSFAYCDGVFDSLTDTAALEMVSGKLGGPPAPEGTQRSTLFTLYNLVRHSNEMYGYMSVYLRLKGIVPPSSEPL